MKRLSLHNDTNSIYGSYKREERGRYSYEEGTPILPLTIQVKISEHTDLQVN